jgi:hypothetical protein
MRPFRFGVNMWGAESRAAWTDKARKVEGLGYSVLTVPDHLLRYTTFEPYLDALAPVVNRLAGT